jgi:hypothetical protein
MLQLGYRTGQAFDCITPRGLLPTLFLLCGETLWRKLDPHTLLRLHAAEVRSPRHDGEPLDSWREVICRVEKNTPDGVSCLVIRGELQLRGAGLAASPSVGGIPCRTRTGSIAHDHLPAIARIAPSWAAVIGCSKERAFLLLDD